MTPYTYLWNNGQTTSAATGLCAGTYTVTATDALATTSTATVTITQPAAIAVNTTTSNASCGQNDGIATATVISGGVSPFTYNWSNSSTNASVTGLSAGPYSLTITDASGCTATASVSIGNNGGPTVSISSQTDVSC